MSPFLSLSCAVQTLCGFEHSFGASPENMTRLEFGLGQKSDGGEAKETGTVVEEDQQPPTVDFVIAEIDLINASAEKTENEAKTKLEPVPPSKTVDWVFVRRVAVAQIILAAVSILILNPSIILIW